jgi:CubicO group peptidase (beta-lactamase class C family)
MRIMMPSKIVATLLFALLFAVAANPALAAPDDNPAELEAFVDGFIASQMKEGNIVGVTLSIVQNGEIILLKGYGYADRDSRTPVDPAKTLFRPGSTSKLFTWTAIMQLVEEGKLDLDTDVQEYLDFQLPERLIGRKSDLPEPITLRHLLTHTAGFEDRGSGLFVLSVEEMTSLEDFLKNCIPARVFPPGTVIAYSNYGTALAGYIVERLSGLPFAEYIEQHIFSPLDMQNSTFRQPLPDPIAANMAKAYKFFNGEYHQGSFEYISALPAGSMSSTAEDMAKFMIAHLQYGRFGEIRILLEATALKMQSRLFSHHPVQDGMAYGFIEQTINGRRLINHGGNTFLFATGCWLLPEENFGLFISYNGGNGLEREALIKAVMNRYYPAPIQKDLLPPPGSYERTLALTGEYHPNRANFTTVEKLLKLMSATPVRVSEDGYLLVNLLGDTQQFVETEPGVYLNRFGDRGDLINKLVFVPNHKGEMMMCAEGPTLTMTRVSWHGSSSLAGLLIGGSLLLVISAAVGWIYASVGRLRRRESGRAPKGALAARLTIIIYGLLLLILFAGIISLVSDIDPAFNVPRSFFAADEAFKSLLFIPYLITLSAIAIVVFTIVSWSKSYWTLGARIHYTLIALSSSGMIWLMTYYNLLQ